MDMLDEMILKRVFRVHCINKKQEESNHISVFWGLILSTCFLTLFVNKTTGR